MRLVRDEEYRPGRSHYYVLGNYESRFALLRYDDRRWRFPWQRPKGGWRIGRYGIWWSL